MDRGEFRKSAIVDLPQIVIAPIALVDLWMMMFDTRQPLDLKAYFNAHLDLVLNGLLTTYDGVTIRRRRAPNCR